MAECMYRDPRRRFTYGFSVEDGGMRLWFCDRAGIVVSDYFEFFSVGRCIFVSLQS